MELQICESRTAAGAASRWTRAIETQHVHDSFTSINAASGSSGHNTHASSKNANPDTIGRSADPRIRTHPFTQHRSLAHARASAPLPRIRERRRIECPWCLITLCTLGGVAVLGPVLGMTLSFTTGATTSSGDDGTHLVPAGGAYIGPIPTGRGRRLGEIAGVASGRPLRDADLFSESHIADDLPKTVRENTALFEKQRVHAMLPKHPNIRKMGFRGR